MHVPLCLGLVWPLFVSLSVRTMTVNSAYNEKPLSRVDNGMALNMIHHPNSLIIHSVNC